MSDKDLDEINGESNGQGVEGQEQNNDVVKYDTYKKVLGQVKAKDAKLRELESSLNEIKAQREADEQAKLEEQNQFKELYESAQEKLKAIETEKETYAQQMSRMKKESALKAELGSLKKDEYMNYADLDSINFNEDGSIDPESVKAVASKFRDEHPWLIESGNSIPNSHAPGHSPQKLSREQWEKLPLAEKKARLHEVI